MTDLAAPEDRNEPAPTEGAMAVAQSNELMEWVQAARQAAGIATSLAKTSFVPASLRGKPEDITAAILAGQELGLRPMATLRSMDVIQGTPALRAHAMRGLVQSHGHEVELVKSTPELCVMRGRRRGSDAWQQVQWDTRRAGQLGLLSKNEWKKQPQTMLVARATGEVCRLIASDVLYAMPYAAEELDTTAQPGMEGATAVPRLTVAEITGVAPASAEVAAGPESDDDRAANEAVGPASPGGAVVWPTPAPIPGGAEQ